MTQHLPTFAGAEISYRVQRIHADVAAAAPVTREHRTRRARLPRRRGVMLPGRPGRQGVAEQSRAG